MFFWLDVLRCLSRAQRVARNGAPETKNLNKSVSSAFHA